MKYEAGQKWIAPSGANEVELMAEVMTTSAGEKAFQIRDKAGRLTYMWTSALKGWSLLPTKLQTEEVRITDPKTGGQKGQKPEAHALIPTRPLDEVARVYGKGAEKYAAWNWAKGYAWNLSISALQRHINAFRRGESADPDDGLHHLAHAAFHLFTLFEFERLSLGTDDRWIK